MPLGVFKRLFGFQTLNVKKATVVVDLSECGMGVHEIKGEPDLYMEEGSHLHILIGPQDLLPKDIEVQFECFRGDLPPKMRLITKLPPCVTVNVFYDAAKEPVTLVGDYEDYRPPV